MWYFWTPKLAKPPQKNIQSILTSANLEIGRSVVLLMLHCRQRWQSWVGQDTNQGRKPNGEITNPFSSTFPFVLILDYWNRPQHAGCQQLLGPIYTENTYVYLLFVPNFLQAIFLKISQTYLLMNSTSFFKFLFC